MRGSSFHQANATIEALTAGITQIRDELVDSINSLSTVVPPTIIPHEQVPPPQVQPPQQPPNE